MHRWPLISRGRCAPRSAVPDVVRASRTLPWREAARDVDALRPMLLDQFRHEDFRGKSVLDLGTGEGRLAFLTAAGSARKRNRDAAPEGRLAKVRAKLKPVVEWLGPELPKTKSFFIEHARKVS